LRLIVANQGAVDTNALKQLGARGLVRPSATALQVVIGTNADQVAGEIKNALRSAQPLEAPSIAPASVLPAPVAQQRVMTVGELPSGDGDGHEPGSSHSASTNDPPSQAHGAFTGPDEATIRGLLAALGGRANVRTVEVAASRLRIGVMKSSAVDAAAIRSLGLRGVAVASPEWVHVIVGPAAAGVASRLQQGP
jgi:PTS system N-acetylglucosamine-specific IIC component